MGKAWLPLFGDKTTEELEKELVKTEKKIVKLDETRIAIKVELALRENENSSKG
jgi:hypothetical protein